MPTETISGPKTAGRPRYDPAFQEAVDAGCLTVRQAYARGKRHVYADGLIRRFGLAPSVAYAVADNRTSLADAMHEKQAAPEPIVVQLGPRPKRRPFRTLIAVGFAVALVAVAWQWWISQPESTPTLARSITRSGDLVLNATGRLLRVVGSTPEAVLASFCGNTPDVGLEPIGLMPASSDATGVRIGVIRDLASDETLLAIAIRRDRASGRWFAGDGLRPIVPRNAPPGALQVVRRH